MFETVLNEITASRIVCEYDGVIPKEATEGYVKLGENAFGHSYLKSIVVSEGVVKICCDCFYQCVRLNSIELPMTLKTIGMMAFCQCTGLERIKVPDSVIKIGPYAFEYCSSLKSIEIGKGVRIIGASAFTNSGIEKKCLYDGCGRLITYKTMNADMTCIDFQYEEGKTYDIAPDKKVTLCRCGFHSCLNPHSCFNYYNGEYGRDIVMCKCVAEGDIASGNDGKVASRKITIVKKFDSYYDVFEDYKKELEKRSVND